MKTYLVLRVAWILGVASTTILAQSSFQNGSFDLPGLPGGSAGGIPSPGSTYLPGWLSVLGYNGTFSEGIEYSPNRGQDPGGYCIELGFYDSINAIQQTFETLPNQQYLVSFWLATDPWNGPPARLRVAANGFSTDYQAPPGSGNESALGWQQQSFSFMSDASRSTTLWFGNLIGTPAIDTISVTAVPEPSAWSVFLTGATIWGIVGPGRRRCWFSRNNRENVLVSPMTSPEG